MSVTFIEVISIARNIFILVKCLFVIYKAVVCVIRYKQTYEVWNQFEIWLFIGMAIKMMLMMIQIFWKHNLNLLFFIFIMNSVMIIGTNYYLQMKALQALYSR